MSFKHKKLLWERWGTVEVAHKNFYRLERLSYEERKAIFMANWQRLLLESSFVSSDRKSYLIGKELFETMVDVNLKIPPSHIPTTSEATFIQFPSLIPLGTPGEFAGGVFVGVFEGEQIQEFANLGGLILFKGERIRGRTFVCVLPIVNKNAMGCSEFLSTIISLEEDSTLESIWERHDRESTSFDSPARIITQTVIKLLVYINSGDPDLRHLMKPRGPGDRRAQAKEFGHFYEQEVFHVGFEWKKPRLYHVDSTIVRGHWRWQPCGPKREQVKLVFIEPHERVYGNRAGGEGGEGGEESKVIIPLAE